MAITKTTTVQNIYIQRAQDTSAEDTSNAKHPTVEVIYEEFFDDPDDSLLPITTSRAVYLHKYVEDGGSATDYSGEDQLVQDVCTAIWT